MTPYYGYCGVVLYLGDCREVLPELGLTFDCAVADPPYGETSLAWDKWPDGWPTVVAAHTRSMWCFGSLRMFLDRRDEFGDWKLSQDVVGYDEDGEPVYRDVSVVWEKHNGSGFAKDRFRRVHEHVLHWYVDAWRDAYRLVPRVPATGRVSGTVSTTVSTTHTGRIGTHTYVDDRTRLMRSVIYVKSSHGRTGTAQGRALHPNQKPTELLGPLISYACPPDGLVLDPFAGSGSTLVAARDSGRRAVGIEADERYAEIAARRLQQGSLFADPA